MEKENDFTVLDTAIYNAGIKYDPMDCYNMLENCSRDSVVRQILRELSAMGYELKKKEI